MCQTNISENSALLTALKHHWAVLRIERVFMETHWTRERRCDPEIEKYNVMYNHVTF